MVAKEVRMTKRTLQLVRETLTSLDADQLRMVAGGDHTLLDCIHYPSNPTCLVTDLTDWCRTGGTR